MGFGSKGLRRTGWLGFLTRHAQAKKGPRRARQVSATIKQLIWALRVREHECCGQKIAYFLEREHQVRLSVPKIYEILAEKYVIRSKWHKNQKRGTVPTASCSSGRHPNGYRGVWLACLRSPGVDIYTKEAAVVLRPALTSEDGAAFLHTAMAPRFTGCVAVLQTDGGPEFKGSFGSRPATYCDRHRIARPYKKNEQAYIESFNRTLRKECLGWGTYRVEELPRLIPEVHTFLDRYHYHRPHLGLVALRPPLTAPSAQEDHCRYLRRIMRWSLAPNKKATFSGGLFVSLLPADAAWALSHCAHSPRTIRIRMLKMASRLGRRELDDRSVPLRYVAGRRATEKNAGRHFQYPVTCPFPRMQDTSSVPSSAYQ